MAGKAVLITGCSAGGIGFALAKEFQRCGLSVFATSRDTDKMSALDGLRNIVLLPLDVTSSTSIASAVEEVASRTGGRLDYLVNNSGRSLHAPALDTDIEAAKDLLDINFWGVLRMVQAFIDLLIEARGTIVNIGSLTADLYTPYSSEPQPAQAVLILTIGQVSTALRRSRFTTSMRHCVSSWRP